MLTQRKILALWFPLAASWGLMTVEYPLIQAAISRLPDAELMLAAAGLVIGLQVTIESPIIMLLSTSTALARGATSFRVIRRFVVHINLALTAIAAALAFVDPLFDALIRDVMSTPTRIADIAQPAMQVMTLWTVFIGWRRFYQGILIRFGRTRTVGYGTLVRLVGVSSTAFGLAYWGELPGVMVGAWSWMAGVLTEAVFVTIVTQSTIREHLTEEREGDALQYGEVARFHAPLAATSLLTLLAMPLILAALARMPDPELNLAAWPVVFAVLLFFRSSGLAYPEVVIAQLIDRSHASPLRRFGWRLGLGVTLAYVAFVISPLLYVYYEQIVRVPEALIAIAVPGLVAGALLPGVQVAQSLHRGVLMAFRRTGEVYWGMGLALAITTAALWAAVVYDLPGVPSAAIALTIGMLLETGYLLIRAKRALNSPQS